MSMFQAIDVAGSGIVVDQTWIDTIGGNVANMDDGVTPGSADYQAQYVDAEAAMDPGAPGDDTLADGVKIAGIQLGPAQGEEEYQPDNPKADAAGEVEYPVVDLPVEMTSLIESQTSYQANASVMSKSTSAYESILNIKA